MVVQHIDPDCRVGKHRACIGWTWDDIYDRETECDCQCHYDPLTKPIDDRVF